jgi:hypothetical protein
MASIKSKSTPTVRVRPKRFLRIHIFCDYVLDSVAASIEETSLPLQETESSQLPGVMSYRSPTVGLAGEVPKKVDFSCPRSRNPGDSFLGPPSLVKDFFCFIIGHCGPNNRASNGNRNFRPPIFRNMSSDLGCAHISHAAEERPRPVLGSTRCSASAMRALAGDEGSVSASPQTGITWFSERNGYRGHLDPAW